MASLADDLAGLASVCASEKSQARRWMANYCIIMYKPPWVMHDKVEQHPLCMNKADCRTSFDPIHHAFLGGLAQYPGVSRKDSATHSSNSLAWLCNRL